MTDEPRTLIDALLAEQGQLTAVEKFARAHESHALCEPRYRDLIPVSLPGAGQQFAFEVDLDRCSGCKACVTACHALNGLDENEAWREVDLLVSHDPRQAFQQVVTSACHHCVDPACLNGCPVLAYEKNTVTGIVRHFDDQCIGCQYCVMMCPYEVPKYSDARGIVRKCDMCSQRLAVQEAPACAQACPNEAIRITIVDQTTVLPLPKGEGWGEGDDRVQTASRVQLDATPFRGSKSNRILPTYPDPAFTLPSTRYVSKAPLPERLVPVDASVPLQPSHWPLVMMLVLTQLSAGAYAMLAATTIVPGGNPAMAWVGLNALFIGLAFSAAHLGKPSKAWRSFLGLGKSWLSREVVAFGIFASLASAVTLAPSFAGALAWVTAGMGAVGVFCSAMVYESTPRPLWRDGRGMDRFFGTMIVLGLAAAWMTGNEVCALLLAITATTKLAFEYRLLRDAWDSQTEEIWPPTADFSAWSLGQSAMLLRDQLGVVTRLRFLCGIAGGVLLPGVSLLPIEHGVVAAVSFVLCLLGELAERYTFFRAVVPPQFSRAHR